MSTIEDPRNQHADRARPVEEIAAPADGQARAVPGSNGDKPAARQNGKPKTDEGGAPHAGAGGPPDPGPGDAPHAGPGDAPHVEPGASAHPKSRPAATGAARSVLLRAINSTHDATAAAAERPASWRSRALGRYAELKLQLDRLALSQWDELDRCQSKEIWAAYESLDFAYTVASGLTRRHAPRGAWRGSDIDNAWIALHRAHAIIVRLTPDGPVTNDLLIDARQRAKQLLKPTDERLLALNRAVRAPATAKTPTVPAGTMRLAAVALAAAYEANAEQHRQVRDFRNILIVTTVVTFVAAVLLGLVGAWWPSALPVCWYADDGTAVCPSSPNGPTMGDVALVEFLGLMAAAVTGAIAIRRLRGTSTPYAVPMWSVLVKLPIGALTAAFGLMLLHVVPGLTVTTRYELVAWALVFGVSQEGFTRLLDRRAQSVLNSISTASKDGTKKSDDDPPGEA